jgi:hypothetical protein
MGRAEATSLATRALIMAVLSARVRLDFFFIGMAPLR